jgi:hypothetical protein
MRLNPYTAKKVESYDRRTGEPFNPKNFGPAGRSGTRREAATEKLWNNQGEVNANNTREVLEKVQGLLAGMSDGTYDVVNRSAAMDEAQSDTILRQAFSDPTTEGFKQVGQALLNPIKEVIDYEGVMRKTWAPRSVKQGEVIRYDKDVFVVAHVIGEDGMTPQSVVEGKYVYPPEFEVSAYPSIELKDQYRAQYDILARAQDKARQGIEYKEDLASINLLRAGGNIKNNTTFFASLNLAAIEAMRYQIERHRLICDKMIINRAEVSDMINTMTPAAVDPVTRRELMMAGFLGTILNVMFITTAGTNPYNYEILAPGEVIAVTAPEYLGGLAVRVELMSEPVTEFHEGRPRRGWYWWEMMALALIVPAGVALGHKI